jgi:hypothetical protein
VCLQEYFDRIEGNEEQIRLEERILAEVGPIDCTLIYVVTEWSADCRA